jgi:hypothetical protein
LKAKDLQLFSIGIITLFLLSFSDPYTIKRISDANFRYEFYTTQKKIKPKTNRIYYWFKGGLIHNAESGIAGELLHDKFIKMYHNNQLAEEGRFRKGLKTGLWKTWYQSGVLESNQKWSNGLRSGRYNHYDEKGNLTETGLYASNRKEGTWIDFIKKDTVAYKKGIIYVKKVKPVDEEKEAKKLKTNQEKNKKESHKTVDCKSTKESFFQRLFKKKKKT